MLLREIMETVQCRVLSGAFLVVFSAGAIAQSTTSPYPGKRQVRLVAVNAPETVVVNFETWPGFQRNFRVTVPGLDVPEDTPNAPDCQRELAARALAFTRHFLSNAKKIFIQDISMENSASEDATSPILTEKGSLAEALIKEGLARPDSVDPREPWCGE